MGNFEGKGCTFKWELCNLSYNWCKKGDLLESPKFCVSSLSSPIPSMWTLILYPRGIVDEEHVGVYLRRENYGNAAEIFEASFQFVFLNKEGSILQRRSISNAVFSRGRELGMDDFFEQDKLFGSGRKRHFPLGFLIILCTLWINDKIPEIIISDTLAQTIFQINRRHFCWRIKGYSTIAAVRTNIYTIRNESKTILMRLSLFITTNTDIKLNIILWHESVKSFSFDICVIDSEKREIISSSAKIMTFDSKERCVELISGEQLIKSKNKYLPNDVLSLVCECAFSTGAIFHAYNEPNYGTISSYIPKKNVKTLTEPCATSELHQAQALVKDLKSMYSDGILCDTELRTSTRNFPTHKNILAARSSVFSRMFSSDMKESNCGHVDITDMEDDTVHRMLLYIYTDSLEDLQIESASKLYSAADKYAIFSLKEKCSRFLKDIISPTTACDLLILADSHQDDSLKSAVQDYILAHDKEIFGTPKWKRFMVTNLQLAANIMYLKVCPS